MRFDGEKILTVRFCFLERRRHVQHIHIGAGGRGRHTHTHGWGGGESKCAEAKVIKCPHLIIILFPVCICSFETFHHEKCCKRAEIPGEEE